MLLKSNINDLKNIIKSENVLFSKEERYCYSQDSTHVNQKITIPDVVVFVETVEDVQKILKYANMHKIPVIARGAGTNMVGACVCQDGGIVLNFSKMNKILEFSPEDMVMKVQPGVVLNDIKLLAEREGLFYPPDPSNFKVSTIGGSIAQSSGGAKSFKYGTTKDYILSLKVVLADGTLMRLGAGTIKDAVGYHLNQLIIGSEGTLAIVVEAELKLIPLPESSGIITAYFDTIQDATSAVNQIIKQRIFPATIDFMDNNSIKTVEEFYPSGLNTTKACLLMIEIDGYESSLTIQKEKIFEILNNYGNDYDYTADKIQMEKVWTARRSSFASTAKLGRDVISDDIIVPRSKLPEALSGIQSICNKYSLKACIVGHIGDGNIHPQIALNMDNDEEFKNYQGAKSEIYLLTVSLGGTISAEHGVGIEKIPYLNKVLDTNSIDYMKKIKMLFDPNNILNPGKIFKL